ncbi:broad substrate specificity ATP-binding cassette transporter ABCG2-like [Chiloscyllium plagiosum]|uniref:broad substrate specificity ATP-binding cassette transporter ABCG2-like n=1 Tax=Chiloscyllium plagiosum TaxID=36176 RepID=UPI001CB7FD09|nr:broad substrate specificity ATP-binding cassette transporter ABCG2-like [Chiloscyllium plagiosum]
MNGMPLSKRLRRSICYVMQQDIFFANLTLRDTLMYQAHLKLPSTMKLHEKEKIVTSLVEELDITKCYNTSECSTKAGYATTMILAVKGGLESGTRQRRRNLLLTQ